MALVTAGFWFYDRIIRACRLAYNSINNEATVEPLPNGGTRVILKKPLYGACAGKHCYLWLPKIRTFQTHPFTIVANNPLELVVTSQDGFTKKLHEFAVANPGASIKASVEGAYGTLPDPVQYDKVILLAGGSGATFSLGLAKDMLERMGSSSKQQVDLVWVVREQYQISWFTEHLTDMLTHERRQQLNLKVHVTSISSGTPETLDASGAMGDISLSSSVKSISEAHEKSALASSSASSSSGTSIQIMDEKKLEGGFDGTDKKNTVRYSLTRLSSGDLSSSELSRNLPADTMSPTTTVVSPSSTLAATPSLPSATKLDMSIPSPSTSPSTIPGGLALLHGRPDISAYIKTAISSMGPGQNRVLIAACGPPAMLKEVRNVAAECIHPGGSAGRSGSSNEKGRSTLGPSIELHLEQFGW